jgi:RimJ/RimL family protein N-acetyltransferase
VSESLQLGSQLNWSPALLPEARAIEGRYVCLERINAERHVADLWKAVAGHDDIWTYLGYGPFADEAALTGFVQSRQHAGDPALYAIRPKPTELEAGEDPALAPLGAAAGWASYLRITPLDGVIEIGHVLFSPSLQRTRAATEAIRLLLGQAFDTLGYRRVEWKCNALNAASRRAAQRYGFVYEGTFRQHMVLKGRNRDTAWFAMLDSDWPAIRARFDAWLDPANFDGDGRQIRKLAVST